LRCARCSPWRSIPASRACSCAAVDGCAFGYPSLDITCTPYVVKCVCGSLLGAPRASKIRLT
jgi:hypothetical protein